MAVKKRVEDKVEDVGKGLVLAKQVGTQLIRPQAKRPVIITRELAKKNKVSPVEWLWINNDLALGAAGGVGVVLSIAMAFIATGFASLIFVGATLLAVAMVVLSGIVVYNREENKGFLTHARREQLAMAEKGREKAPHASQRLGRARELDHKYDHFSVRLAYGEKSIIVALIRHKPWKEGRYKDEVVQLDLEITKVLYPSKYEELKAGVEKTLKEQRAAAAQDRKRRDARREQEIRDYGSPMTIDVEDGPDELDEREVDRRVLQQFKLGKDAVVEITRKDDEDWDEFQMRVAVAQEEFEEAARVLEDESYEDKREALEIKKIALIQRRG